MVSYLWVAIVFCLTHLSTAEIRTEASCSPDDEVCEFDLQISTSWSMMHFIRFGMMLPVIIDENGTYFARSKSCDRLIQLTDKEASQVIIGDGRQKPVLVFNKQLPGPSLVVYEGQQVTVKVKNDMSGYVTTVHWHGQVMDGSPYMDGVAGISQYPIPPRQTFTYRFNATRLGTHFYHTHLGTQRSMGAYGPLVVLPRPEKKVHKTKTDDYADDFIMTVSDWMTEDSQSILLRMSHDNLVYAYGYENDSCYSFTKGVDGLDVGITPFISAVVNGKGRHFPGSGGMPENTNIPLETFTVKKSKSSKVRFRMISASMIFSFKVSIDHHDLHVISTDGDDIDTVTVQYIIISPGERYDFWITPTDPDKTGSYWIRLTTLEVSQNGKVIPAGHTAAILKYKQLTDRKNKKIKDPESESVPCTKKNMCKVLNCPFEDYQEEFHYQCIGLGSLRARDKRPVISPESEEDLVEIFLNFHFSGFQTLEMFKPNINGKVYLPSEKPVQLQTTLGPVASVPCNETECAEEVCFCTHQLNIPLNKVVQMVIFTNMPDLSPYITGTHHPIHLHGHHMEVVKVAYPTYDKDTHLYKSTNTDIRCTVNDLCNEATWANSSWKNGNIPGMVQQGAPRKDTIQIPGGGYVVVRFRSDNPGFWFMHCHMEVHNLLGMALVIKEGELEDMPAYPSTPSTRPTKPKSTHLLGLKNSGQDLLAESLLKEDLTTEASTTEKLGVSSEEACEAELTHYLVAITIFAISSILLFLIFLRLTVLELNACKEGRNSTGLTTSRLNKAKGYEREPLLM